MFCERRFGSGAFLEKNKFVFLIFQELNSNICKAVKIVHQLFLTFFFFIVCLFVWNNYNILVSS